MTTEKTCPLDGTALTFMGSCGIVDYDGKWEAETCYYRCVNDHAVFVADADRIENRD